MSGAWLALLGPVGLRLGLSWVMPSMDVGAWLALLGARRREVESWTPGCLRGLARLG